MNAMASDQGWQGERGVATEGPRARGVPGPKGRGFARREGFGAGSALGSRGQALVETALVLPLLLIVIVGLFDVGRAIWLSNTLATAVREGTRYGVVHGALSGSPTGPGAPTYTAPDTDTAITAQVRNYATGVPSNLTVLSTWPDGNANRGSRIVVSATFPFTPILAQVFLGGGLGITLRSSSTLVIEQ
jgi:Flp pilus assembly protein TadG